MVNDPNIRQMYAKAIGELAVNYLEETGGVTAAALMQAHALRLIYDIKTIINQQNLDEAESYRCIKAIVEKFYSDGFGVPHHY